MKKLFIVIIVIIVIAGGFLLLKKRKGISHQPEYQTIKVERGNIKVNVLSTGTIQPYTRVEVKSPISGRIDKIEVDEGDKVKVGDILTWISSEDRIALLDAAKSELEQAQKSKDEQAIKEARHSYEIADKSYKPTFLTTSVSGEVINRSCEPGQNVTTQSILFVISDRLVAGVQVDEVDIGKIRLGQSAKIVLDAFPDERIEGTVNKIARESRRVSDVIVYDVIVSPDNVPQHWASGMTAKVEFFIESKEGVLTIPRSAIKEQGGRKFVMVLPATERKNNPVPRGIEIGISDGKKVEVISGLTEGEEIILSSEEKTTSVSKGPRGMFMRGRR